jgi:hypothetical protein
MACLYLELAANLILNVSCCRLLESVCWCAGLTLVTHLHVTLVCCYLSLSCPSGPMQSACPEDTQHACAPAGFIIPLYNMPWWWRW